MAGKGDRTADDWEGKGYKFQLSALFALQEAAESFLVGLFEDTITLTLTVRWLVKDWLITLDFPFLLSTLI